MRHQEQRRWTEPEREILQSNFRKMTYRQIGELLQRPWTSVRHQANSLGLTQGSNLGRKYSANLDFFSEPNTQNSYWAGFIAADGCVRGNRLQIKLAAKDLAHLARFAHDIEYTGPISHPDGQCVLQVACQRYVDDLARHFNITPRKSLTLAPPNITTTAEIRAFITGVIDGDGSITQNRYKTYERQRITIYGTAKLLGWIQTNFDRWSPPGPRRASGVRRLAGRELYEYSVTAGRAIRVGSVLREVEVPRLARKWDRLPVK